MNKEKYTFKKFLKDLKEITYDVSTDIISKVIVIIINHKTGLLDEPQIFSCPNIKCCQCPYNYRNCRYKNY